MIDIDTDLSGIAKFEEGYFTGCIFKVGILANNAPIACFTTQFECHGGKISGCSLHNMTPHSRGSCVENLVETLSETHVGNIVPAVYQGDVFRGKMFVDEFLEHGSTSL